MNLNCRAYSLVLRLYPADLRQRFGEEMLDVFEQHLESVRRESGLLGLAHVWIDIGREVIRDAVPDRFTCAGLGVPVDAALSSSALFLLFFWAAGIARHCAK